MKKEGNMRITSYNKFFAEVAQIMNTSVKAVKQLEGRYKIELSNNVHFYVFRGVTGGLSIHDHRGTEPIISCYNFEDFKTIKDLYERLVSDYSESAEKEVMEVKQELNSSFGKEQYFDTDSVKVAPLPEQKTGEKSMIDTIIADDNIAYQTAKVTKTKHSVLDVMQCMMCPADREGNRCGGKQWCKQTWKRYSAIVNPEWHHVSLATLANIDFDMLDVKRQIYFKLNKDFKKMCNDLRKCKSGRSFDARLCNFRAKLTTLNTYEKISLDMSKYLDRQISMMNVECGMWTSRLEIATGCHKSRKHNHHALKY